jgi:hypothetical protein
MAQGSCSAACPLELEAERLLRLWSASVQLDMEKKPLGERLEECRWGKLIVRMPTQEEAAERQNEEAAEVGAHPTSLLEGSRDSTPPTAVSAEKNLFIKRSTWR